MKKMAVKLALFSSLGTRLSVHEPLFIVHFVMILHGEAPAKLKIRFFTIWSIAITWGNSLDAREGRDADDLMGYRRPGFDCDILLIANCEFFYNSQSKESQEKEYAVTRDHAPFAQHVFLITFNCRSLR